MTEQQRKDLEARREKAISCLASISSDFVFESALSDFMDSINEALKNNEEE